jgi:predicted transcriptional regulator
VPPLWRIPARNSLTARYFPQPPPSASSRPNLQDNFCRTKRGPGKERSPAGMSPHAPGRSRMSALAGAPPASCPANRTIHSHSAAIGATDLRLQVPATDEVELDAATLAAIDRGVKTAGEGRTVSLEEARKTIPQWISKFGNAARWPVDPVFARSRFSTPGMRPEVARNSEPHAARRGRADAVHGAAGSRSGTPTPRPPFFFPC